MHKQFHILCKSFFESSSKEMQRSNQSIGGRSAHRLTNIIQCYYLFYETHSFYLLLNLDLLCELLLCGQNCDFSRNYKIHSGLLSFGKLNTLLLRNMPISHFYVFVNFHILLLRNSKSNGNCLQCLWLMFDRRNSLLELLEKETNVLPTLK